MDIIKADSALPSFLQNREPISYGEMNNFAKPPRIKVIQALTGAPFKPPFREGDVIVNPQMNKIADHETAFTFTPLAFFANYALINPPQMKSTLPYMREISFDANSEVAKRAAAFQKFPCPENKDYFCKYITMLNFIVMVHDHDMIMPAAITFSKGEFRSGQLLIGLIQARGQLMYACRFRAISATHSGKMGSWEGLDIMNDPDLWVTEEQFTLYEKRAKEFEDLINSRKIDIDYDDTDMAEADKETKF